MGPAQIDGSATDEPAIEVLPLEIEEFLAREGLGAQDGGDPTAPTAAGGAV